MRFVLTCNVPPVLMYTKLAWLPPDAALATCSVEVVESHKEMVQGQLVVSVLVKKVDPAKIWVLLEAVPVGTSAPKVGFTGKVEPS